MIASILTSVKKMCGLTESFEAFDADILTYINAVFVTLNQLGIGPTDGFAIEDKTTTWDAYLGDDKNLNDVKTYMYLRVRTLFDPPTTSFLIEAMNNQIAQLEWRLNVRREGESWVDPNAA